MKGESQHSGKPRPSRKLGAAAATLEPLLQTPVLRRTRKHGHRLGWLPPGDASDSWDAWPPRRSCCSRGRGGLAPSDLQRERTRGPQSRVGGNETRALWIIWRDQASAPRCPVARRSLSRGQGQRRRSRGPQGSAVNCHLRTVTPGLCVPEIRPGH